MSRASAARYDHGHRSSDGPGPEEENMIEPMFAKALGILDEIVQCELAGVVRYTHYSLLVSGPHRLPLVDFMKAQASESLTHAQAAGEMLTGLGGHPSIRVAAVDETHEHSVEAMVQDRKAIQAGTSHFLGQNFAKAFDVKFTNNEGELDADNPEASCAIWGQPQGSGMGSPVPKLQFMACPNTYSVALRNPRIQSTRTTARDGCLTVPVVRGNSKARGVCSSQIYSLYNSERTNFISINRKFNVNCN